MDKYEYRIRAEEINNLIEKKEYVEAVKIADTIDWRRVRSVVMLCKVSELYKINRRYEDSKEVLLLAYELQNKSRKIIYSLCELSIKLEETVQAVEYYKEFVKVAPRDTGRFILQYRLYEAQDVSLEERIAVLEEYKKRDYREKWAYELAYLYHRIGLATRCIEECDELILWFGEGKYVIKAMELKMLHAPLDPKQQEKYNARFMVPMEEMLEEEQEQEESENVEPSLSIEIKSVEATKAKTAEILKQEVMKELMPEEEEIQEEIEAEEDDDVEAITQEIPDVEEVIQEEEPESESDDEEEMQVVNPNEELDIQVKTIDVGDEYNTINLQDELAKNLAEIFAQEDMEALDATKALPIDSIFQATSENFGLNASSLNDPFNMQKEEENQIPEVEELEEIESNSDIDEIKEISLVPEVEEIKEIVLIPEDEENKEEPKTEVIEEIKEEPKVEAVQEVTEEPKAEAVQEIKEEPKAEVIEEIKEEPKVEAIEEIKEEPKAEVIEEIKEEPKAEVIEEIKEEPKAEAVQEVTEEPKVVSVAEEVKEEPKAEVIEEIKEEPKAEAIEEIKEEPKAEAVQEIKEEPKNQPVVPEIEPLVFSQNQPLSEVFIQAVQMAAIEAAKQAAVEAIKEIKPVEKVEEEPKAEVIEEPKEEPVEKEEVEEAVEKQITGQLSFTDIMAEWEQTKKANEEKHLEEIKQRVKEQTGPLLANYETETKASAQTNLDLLSPTLDVFSETEELATKVEDALEEETTTTEEKMSEPVVIPVVEKEPEPVAIPVVEKEPEPVATPVVEREPEPVATPVAAKDEKKPMSAAEAVAMAAAAAALAAKKNEQASFNTAEINGLEEKLMGTLSTQHYDTANLQASVLMNEMEKGKSVSVEPRLLTKEEKELFGSFCPTKDLQEKMAEVLDKMSFDRISQNVIVTGEPGTGALVTAKKLVQYLEGVNRQYSGNCKMLSSREFTGKNIFELVNEMPNGVIIVENAGEMSVDLCNKMFRAAEEMPQGGILYILVDTKAEMDKLSQNNAGIAKHFNLTVDIAALDNDSLVNFGKWYAREKEYSIDDMGVLALYNRIEERQTSEHAVTVHEVKEMIHGAIEKSEKRNISHFMDVIFAKRYDKDDMIILREKDFIDD